MMQSCTPRVSSSGLFMVSCISLCLLLSIDSIVSADLLNLSIGSIASTNDLIKSKCSKTRSNPMECEMVLRRDPRSKRATKPIELANIMLDLAIANTTKCVESLTRLQNLGTTPPAWKAALKACAKEFTYAASEFRMVKQELTEDPQSASYDAFVVGDSADTCDHALKNAHVNLPQVTAYGNNIRFFAMTANDMIDFY